MDSWTSLSIAYPKQWVIWATTQNNDWQKEIGIFAVLAVCDHHVSSILAILGIWGPKGSFFVGGRGVCRIACCFSLIQGLSKAYHLSPYQALIKPLAIQPPLQNPGQITLPDFQWAPGNSLLSENGHRFLSMAYPDPPASPPTGNHE